MEDKEFPDWTQFPSWTQKENGEWVAPVPQPDDGGKYAWNEEELCWIRTDAE
jgi:hypothetical protein